MTDKTERMLEQARADAMRDVVPPGVDSVRRTVRRRRTVTTVTGAALLTALTIGLTVLIGQAGRTVPAGNQAAGPETSAEPSLPGMFPGISAGPSLPGMILGTSALPGMIPGTSAEPSFPGRIPEPDPTALSRMDVASAALGDPDTTPWTMATAGMVSGDYQNHVNDIPEGDYHLYFFCVGEGTIQVVVKAQNAGDQVLATGSVPCGETAKPAKLAVHQPISGYLRVYLSGDSRANAGAAFAFKFVNMRGEQPVGSGSPS